MPTKDHKVECQVHGSQAATFVCQHLAAGDGKGVCVGLDPENPLALYPDAWCEACERRRTAAGEWTDAGVALGNLGNAIGASAGLAAVFSASSLAFEVVRYLGALYLLFLGWRALQKQQLQPVPAAYSPRTPGARVLRDGFFIALLNPKTALFFAAFLPQFVAPATSHAFQPVVLGILFVLLAASTDSLYAIFASFSAPYFQRARSAVSVARFATGGAYFGLGLFAALNAVRGNQ